MEQYEDDEATRARVSDPSRVVRSTMEIARSIAASLVLCLSDRVASLANVTRDRVVNVLLALEVARQTRATGAAEPA